MSTFIDTMVKRAKTDVQTIVLPEGNDVRTLAAAEKVLAQNVAKVIILGDETQISQSGYALEGARIVNPKTAGERQAYADRLFELRQKKGMTPEKALSLMDDEIYFGTMMVKMGDADGMVTGACHATSDVLRASLQILKTAPGIKSVSSFFVMVVPNCEFGDDGVFLFSDCGLEIQPDAEKLAHIAVNSGRSWRTIFGTQPRIAMLSHSTFGSAAQNDDRDKVSAAVKLAQAEAPDELIDGEMQLDAAIVPSVAASKAPNPPLPARRTCSSSPTSMRAISATSWYSVWLMRKLTVRSPKVWPLR